MYNMHNKLEGNYGENIAAKFLQKKGYKILSRNYYSRNGEIDIIAWDDSVEDGNIVFVEVKSRFNRKYGYPSEAVTFSKKVKLYKTAISYIVKNNIQNVQFRFDIIEIYLKEKLINHIENAFYVDWS